MCGQYDVVHIAVFVLLISKNDAVPLLNNLIKMLSREYEYLHPADSGTDKLEKNQVAISSGTSWIGVIGVHWRFIPPFLRVIFVRFLTMSHCGRMRLGQRRNNSEIKHR